MRASQWFILGIFLIAMSTWFITQDAFWNSSCDMFDDSQLTKADMIACLNSEIFDPFIWLLFPLSVVFGICGVVELIAEKKRR